MGVSVGHCLEDWLVLEDPAIYGKLCIYVSCTYIWAVWAKLSVSEGTNKQCSYGSCPALPQWWTVTWMCKSNKSFPLQVAFCQGVLSQWEDETRRGSYPCSYWLSLYPACSFKYFARKISSSPALLFFVYYLCPQWIYELWKTGTLFILFAVCSQMLVVWVNNVSHISFAVINLTAEHFNSMSHHFGGWGGISVGRVFAQHAQSPKF